MENKSSVNRRPFFLLKRQVIKFGTGDCALVPPEAGRGSIHFFMPLIFVNQGGFSATTVGLPWAVVRLQAS